MNAPEAAAKEAERALKNGANAVQLATNANGVPLDEPRFLPIFDVIAASGKPILLHPSRTREMPDYPTEKYSKYEICSVLGWPYETGVTLARLVFSKIMDRYPDLKVIAHHLGGVIPYLEGRVGHSFDQMGVRTSDEDYESLRKSLKKRPFDYFKDFYGDTAVEGARVGDGLRPRFLRRRSRAVRVRLPVRQGKRPGLHPRHHQGAQLATAVERGAREDLLSATPRSCSGLRRPKSSYRNSAVLELARSSAGAVRRCGRRAQLDPTNRQRARRCVVRLANRTERRLSVRRQGSADHFGDIAHRRRCGHRNRWPGKEERLAPLVDDARAQRADAGDLDFERIAGLHP